MALPMPMLSTEKALRSKSFMTLVSPIGAGPGTTNGEWRTGAPVLRSVSRRVCSARRGSVYRDAA